MPHGAPDDSNVVKQGDMFRLDDMAELAARLGSPVAYERYGDVVFMDSFEDGLQAWTQTVFGTAGHIQLDSDQWLTAGVSVEILTGTGALPAAQIRHYNAPLDTRRAGFHIAFALGANVDRIVFAIDIYDGINYYKYRVKYDHTIGDLLYYDENGVYVSFATHGLLVEHAQYFHHAKLVLNLADNEYARFYFDDSSYDLPDLLPQQTADATLPTINIVVYVRATAGNEAYLYLDDAVLTQNEF